MLMPSFPLAARALIAEQDVVQVHIPMLETWLVTALAKRRGVPSVVLNHGDLIMPPRPLDQLIQRTLRGLMRRGLEDATAVVAHTEDYAQHSEFTWPFRDKLHYMFPPNDIPVPSPAGVAALRARLGIGEAPVVGFAGRFVEEKGFDYLLQAVPLITAEMPDVRFVFAGERFVVYESFYQQWANLFEGQPNRVIALGLLHDPQELADFYAMCDVFTNPARTDNFGLVQVEALLCGTPVVTSDIPGARTIVWASGAGVLVEPRNPRALAEAILHVLRDPAPYTKPRAEIDAIFGARRSLDAYEALYRSLVEERHRGVAPV
jgi:glycosyltransferase involved in cell wall biosynthesis